MHDGVTGYELLQFLHVFLFVFWLGPDVAVRAFVTPIIGRQVGIAWKAGSPRAAEARQLGELVRDQLRRAPAA